MKLPSVLGVFAALGITLGILLVVAIQGVTYSEPSTTVAEPSPLRCSPEFDPNTRELIANDRCEFSCEQIIEAYADRFPPHLDPVSGAATSAFIQCTYPRG